MHELRNTVIREELPENKNSGKIVEKILNFNKQINLILDRSAFYTPNQTEMLNGISKQDISPLKINEIFINEFINNKENVIKKENVKYLGNVLSINLSFFSERFI